MFKALTTALTLLGIGGFLERRIGQSSRLLDQARELYAQVRLMSTDTTGAQVRQATDLFVRISSACAQGDIQLASQHLARLQELAA